MGGREKLYGGDSMGLLQLSELNSVPLVYVRDLTHRPRVPSDCNLCQWWSWQGPEPEAGLGDFSTCRLLVPLTLPIPILILDTGRLTTL